MNFAREHITTSLLSQQKHIGIFKKYVLTEVELYYFPSPSPVLPVKSLASFSLIIIAIYICVCAQIYKYRLLCLHFYLCVHGSGWPLCNGQSQGSSSLLDKELQATNQWYYVLKNIWNWEGIVVNGIEKKMEVRR